MQEETPIEVRISNIHTPFVNILDGSDVQHRQVTATAGLPVSYKLGPSS